jgi:flagellar protein FliO/FliZ
MIPLPNLLRTIRFKALGALVLLAALLGISRVPFADVSASTWLLAAALMGTGALLVKKARSPDRLLLSPKRLEVIAKVGLSTKCGVALLVADGRSYLLVHGEGFATMRQTRGQR